MLYKKPDILIRDFSNFEKETLEDLYFMLGEQYSVEKSKGDINSILKILLEIREIENVLENMKMEARGC